MLLSRLARVALFALAYYVLGLLSYRASAAAVGPLAAWWAPSGLALAVMVRARRQSLPWFAGGIAIASALLNLRQPLLAPEVALRTASDLIEPLTSGWLLRTLFGRKLNLGTLQQVFGFAVIGGLLGPAAGTAVLAVGYLVAGTMPAAELFSLTLVWWGSAVLGATLFAPVLLTWRRRPRLLRGARFLEASLLGALLLALAVGVFFAPTPSLTAVLVGFAAFPLLAWAATRFGTAGAARATVVLSLLSVWPFVATAIEPRTWQLIAIQGIYALGAVTALTLAALTSETQRLRVRAEAHARGAEESLALLESALRSAPFGVAFFDRSLRVMRVNEVFASLGGHRVEELVGRSLDSALREAAPRVRGLLRSVLSGEGVVETDVETHEGPQRFWLCSAFPVWVRSDRPIGAGLLMIDVTERRAVEEERKRLYREAAEAVRVREDFLSIASHELKTPLTPLAARLSFIQRKLQGGEQISPQSIDKPLKSLRQVTDLINDLLDASRIEHGRLLLHREPHPVNDLVRQAAEQFRDTSPLHKLEIDTPREPLWINADAQRIAQVVSNLVDNAIKYSPSGGQVRVKVQPHPDGVEITVSDQGIGIPPEQQERLFERFYRATNAAVSYGGLGLGLYITRDIVDRHGGRIWADSTPGHGTTFHVVLPRISAAELQVALH